MDDVAHRLLKTPDDAAAAISRDSRELLRINKNYQIRGELAASVKGNWLLSLGYVSRAWLGSTFPNR